MLQCHTTKLCGPVMEMFFMRRLIPNYFCHPFVPLHIEKDPSFGFGGEVIPILPLYQRQTGGWGENKSTQTNHWLEWRSRHLHNETSGTSGVAWLWLCVCLCVCAWVGDKNASVTTWREAGIIICGLPGTLSYNIWTFTPVRWAVCFHGCMCVYMVAGASFRHNLFCPLI